VRLTASQLRTNQRIAAVVVRCANAPRRLQESRSRRRAHAGADKIGRAVGTLLNRRKVAKHYITDHALSFMHDHAAIAAEAALRTIGATPFKSVSTRS
jgi:hypothetical protein